LWITWDAVTRIDDRLLESKMTQIEQAQSWSPRVISKFEALIRSSDDLSLYRVNSPTRKPSISSFMPPDVACSR
jgi:hypothetical protein